MKTYSHKDILESILLFLVIAFFGFFYWQTVIYLPLFGDATIHGMHAVALSQKGWQFLTADYPPFYYYIMVIFNSIFGEKGFNIVPYFGVLFLLLSTFLLIRQLTKNYLISLLSLVVVACSPKIIYYSSRMYQEILISSLFIFSIFLFFKYLEERKQVSLFILLLFIGITLSIKQQGLFILYGSICLFFVIDLIRKKTSFGNLLVVIILPIVVGLPFYGVLLHTRGSFQPGSNEFGVFRVLNGVGQKIFLYKNDQMENFNSTNNSNANVNVNNDKRVNSLDEKLNQIEAKWSSVGTTHAETKHIWPLDVFTNFDKFNLANNLYVDVQGRGVDIILMLYFFFFSLLFGWFYCIFRFKLYSNLLIFTLIFLVINYMLFARNADQSRYHLFLPIFLLSFTAILLNQIAKKISINTKLKSASLIALIFLIYFSILDPRLLSNRVWINSQIYSSSVGGIQSIQETGEWFKKSTNEATIFGQQCGNETSYYANRKEQGDWRIYFLNENDLKDYFIQKKISYYVIFDSQVVDDDKWYSLCWVPKSFVNRIQKNYKKVFSTTKKDIKVYKLINVVS